MKKDVNCEPTDEGGVETDRRELINAIEKPFDINNPQQAESLCMMTFTPGIATLAMTSLF